MKCSIYDEIEFTPTVKGILILRNSLTVKTDNELRSVYSFNGKTAKCSIGTFIRLFGKYCTGLFNTEDDVIKTTHTVINNKEFNINNYVKLELTALGKKVLNNYAEILSMLTKTEIKEATEYLGVKDNTARLQFWKLCWIFYKNYPHVKGFEPFKPTIELCI